MSPEETSPADAIRREQGWRPPPLAGPRPRYRGRIPQEFDGWRRPADPDAPGGHATWVEEDRHRVICRCCPWFRERLGATRAQLKAMGDAHRHATRPDGGERR